MSLFWSGFIVLSLLLAAAAPGAGNAVEITGGGHVGLKPQPKLTLSNAQREQIRKAVLTEHNEVEFRLKSTKNARDFTPTVGAMLPKGVQPMAFPQSLGMQMPQLRNFSYVKMKDQVLIVDATTRKIVDVFSEAQPQG
jgi:hypothetical protein